MENAIQEPTESATPDTAPVDNVLDTPADGNTETTEAPDTNLLADDSGEGEEGESAKEGDQTDKPTEYEDFALPDGFVKDGAMLEAFVPLAKEAGLTQEQAQKFVDLGTEMVKKASADTQKAWAETTGKWAADVKADPDFGGAKLKENSGLAIRALKQFGDPELKQYLDESRLGNHPGLFKLLVRVGRAVSEDKLFDGGAAAAEQSAAKILYPNLK